MAYTEFYAQSGGNVMNGGSDTGNSAGYTSTNGNWNGTVTYTPTDGSTPANTVTVGQFAGVYVDGATTPVYIARVTAVAAGVNGAITLSSTAAAGAAPSSSATARSIKVGGAWGLPSGSATFPLLPLSGFAAATDSNGDMPRINFQCGGAGGIDCAMTAGITNNVAGPYVLQGYKTSVGDGETNNDTQANQVNYKLRIDGASGNFTLYSITAADIRIADMVVSNNGTGTVAGWTTNSSRGVWERCIAFNIRSDGFAMTGGGSTQLVECEAYSCNQANSATHAGVLISANIANIVLDRCTIHDNTGSNVSGLLNTAGSGITLLNCVFSGNGLYGVYLNSSNIETIRIENCDFYNNAADGIRLNPTSANGGWVHIENSNFENNGQSSGTGYGINRADSKLYHLFISVCAFYNNKTGASNGLIGENVGAITNTASAYNNAGNGDFRPIGTGGPNVQGKGRSTFTQTKSGYSGTVGYPDTVAAQHQDQGPVGCYVASP